MFAWIRTWYAKRDGVYYNFDMKRQRDDAVKNHNMVKVPAVEAAGLVEKMPDGKWHAITKAASARTAGQGWTR